LFDFEELIQLFVMDWAQWLARLSFLVEADPDGSVGLQLARLYPFEMGKFFLDWSRLIHINKYNSKK
jgi:hypothetical protein